MFQFVERLLEKKLNTQFICIGGFLKVKSNFGSERVWIKDILTS